MFVLHARLALGAGAIAIDQTADRGEVAGFELRHRGAYLGDAADDLVTRNAGIDGRHCLFPLIAHLGIGVADAAEKDVDLHVVFGWIAPCDCRRSKRRGRAGGGVSLRFVH